MADNSKVSAYRTTTLAFAEFPVEAQAQDYDESTHTWRLGSLSTIPRSLEDYAKSKGQQMPEGLYVYYGNSSRFNTAQEMRYLDSINPPSTGYDLRLSIALPRKGLQKTTSRALIWKTPEDINALYLGIGRTTKATNDLLRFYTGERFCIDRLTAEPWRVDEYIDVLEMQHGRLKAVVFNAMNATGRTSVVMRILDPSIVEEIQPLGVFTSLHDPDPPEIALPAYTWGGWMHKTHLSDVTRDEIRKFISVPETDLSTRHEMIHERSGRLLASGAIKPNQIMEDLIEERLSS